MKIHAGPFRVDEGTKVKLGDWPTLVKPTYESKKQYEELLTAHLKELTSQQDMLYASNTYALLLIFQAMDAAGKDGAIKHVMSGVNPQGCDVHSFKHPSAEELEHDFLWRSTWRLPERGRIGIFNRSYYEEVLIVRVHPAVLEAENLPSDLCEKDSIWHQRYQSIVDLERHLHRNGTRVVKFFLHLSKEEQRKRFLKRIEDAEKNWKISPDDMKERKYWDDYQTAYEKCLSATSTKHAPWYIVPADDKENARLIVSEVILHTMRDMELRYPKPTAEQRSALPEMKKALLKEKD